MKTNKSKLNLPKIKFFWKKSVRPESDDSFMINGKTVVFVGCSIISALINLIFISNLTKSPYQLGTVLSIPAAIFLGTLSIGLDLSKALHVIQVNTLGELYQELAGKYDWAKNIKKLKNRWFTVYLLYVILSIITSVSLSSISIGAGITRNTNTLKQIDDFIEKGEQFTNVSEASTNIEFKSTIKKATSTVEDDAASYAENKWNNIESDVNDYQSERSEFTSAGYNVDSKTEVTWHGNTIIPNNYWTKKTSNLSAKVKNSGYSGSTTGTSLGNLSESLFISNVRQSYISNHSAKNADDATSALKALNTATDEKALAWINDINNTKFKFPDTFDSDGKFVKGDVLYIEINENLKASTQVQSALSRLSTLRVAIENDNGDIGSSSKIFMQVGSAIDNRKNNKATDNLETALDVKKSTGSLGTTEILMMLMLLFLSLLCELAINQFSPKTKITRKMLSNFAQYFPRDFDIDDFMIGVLIRQLKYGDITKEQFDTAMKDTTMMMKYNKEYFIDLYSPSKEAEEKKRQEELDGLHTTIKEKESELATVKTDMESLKVKVTDEALLNDKISSLQDTLGNALADNKNLTDKNSELELKITDLQKVSEQTNSVNDESLNKLKEVISTAKDALNS